MKHTLSNCFSDQLFSFSKGSKEALIALWFLLGVLNPLPQEQNLKSPSLPAARLSLATIHPLLDFHGDIFFGSHLICPDPSKGPHMGLAVGSPGWGPLSASNLCSPCLCLRQLCGKEFNRMHNLMGHMHLHSDSKPFKCLYCPSKFTLKGNLTRHMKVKHGVMERGLHSQGINLPRSPHACEASGWQMGSDLVYRGLRFILMVEKGVQLSRLQQGSRSKLTMLW